MRTKRGFTLVELLVVIAIIALLMGILMPALSRVRQLAFRMTCGTNLAGIGKAMLIYANDYDDELPRSGGRNSVWGTMTPNGWSTLDRRLAFALGTDGSAAGNASISSCFYLLVKYAEVTPKSFICKGDAGTTEFKLNEAANVPANFELIDGWDFGTPTEAFKHCSYTYHMPFGLYALTTSSEPGFAVAADRNPWIASPAAAFDSAKFATFKPDVTHAGGTPGTSDQARNGNAIAHQNDGQNVLFLDSHVEFAKRAFCGVEDDNIYTTVRPTLPSGSADLLGVIPTPGSACLPLNRKDAVLVHDPDKIGPKGRFCFAGSTPVWVGGRVVPISQAAAGRQVLATGRRGGMMLRGVARIDTVDVHPGVFDESRRVVLANGESLHVIGSHRFLLASGAWTPVENLKAGSVLQTVDGCVRVADVIESPEPYVGTVYNLNIADADNYLVGRTGVVVRDY